MARSANRSSKPKPITDTQPVPVIEVNTYREQIKAAALSAAVLEVNRVERALDLYIRARLSPPASLADKRAHMRAIVKHGSELFRLLSAVRNLEAHREFRADLDARKTRSTFYVKLFGMPNTPINPSILQEMNTTRDQLAHLLCSARWIASRLNKRPPSPTQVLVQKLGRLVRTDKQLRALLQKLNEVLELVRADFRTVDLRVKDIARVVRERKK